MNNMLTLYIPDPKTGAMALILDTYERRMARQFGGATLVYGTGLWINGRDELEREPVVMITSYFSGEFQIRADVLASSFIHDLKRNGEEAVMIVRNGKAIIA